jgi:hypothetical protein
MQVIIKLAIRYRFNLPPYYTLIVRSLGSLEGIALRVDPTFSIVSAAIPILLRRMLTDTRRSAVQLLRELLLEDGGKLRVGMLEGLLRNYSAEAGLAVQQSPAAGVVLKGTVLEVRSTAWQVPLRNRLRGRRASAQCMQIRGFALTVRPFQAWAVRKARHVLSTGWHIAPSDVLLT